MTATSTHLRGTLSARTIQPSSSGATAHSRRMTTEHDLTPERVGARYLASSGRIWTVSRVTPRGDRLVLAAPSPDGDVAMVVDPIALRQMIALDPVPTET